MKKLGNAFKSGILALLYVGIYYAVTYVVRSMYVLWQESLGKTSGSEIILGAKNNTYALGVIAMIITFWVYLIVIKKRNFSIDYISEKKKNPAIIYAMAICLAIGLRLLVSVYFSYSQGVEVLKKSIDDAATFTPELTNQTQIMIALFSIAVITPLFEEFLFRGLVMHELMTAVRPWLAILLQAVLFGFAHGVLFQSLFTFIIGILLGIVYYRTQNLKTVALCHGAFNISVILAQSELTLETGIMVTVMGLVLVVFSMSYILMYCKRK